MLLSVRFHSSLADYLLRYTNNHLVAQIIGFIGIILGVILAVGLLTRLLERGVEALRLKGVNRLFGAVFGLAQASVLVCAALLALSHYGGAYFAPLLTNSTLGKYMLQFAQSLVS